MRHNPSEPEQDFDAWECQHCCGKGWNWKEFQVAERKSDVQTFRHECDECGGLGYQGPDAEAKSKHNHETQTTKDAYHQKRNDDLWRLGRSVGK